MTVPRPFPRQRWRLGGALAVASVLVVAACGGHTASAVPSAGSAPAAHSARAARVPGGDWTRFDYDAARTGVGPSQTGLSAKNVGGLGRRVVRIDGVADSSAVELHSVNIHGRRRDLAIVSTTYGKAIAIDLGSGRRLWEFTPSDIRSYQGSHQITAASPVLDPSRRYVYTASPDGLIRKLSVASGREVRSGNWPARVTYDPSHEKISSALNLSGHDVVAVTGGYFGDAPPYQGHVALIDRASGRIDHVWNSLCSDRHALINPPSSCPASDSAIWARAGAVIEPGSGRILVSTGNGPFNGSTNWGDSVLELAPDASQLLQNWTPTDQAQLNSSDTDLGSTAPALLPGGFAVQGGKTGQLDLLDLAHLNGTGGAGPKLGGQVQTIGAPGGGEVFTAPATWTSGGRTYLFVADNEGTAAYLFSAGRLSVAWQQGTAGTSPIVAGGLLYVYDQNAGKLNVRDPASGRLIASLPAGGGHWNSPIVVGGRIVLPVGGSTADNTTSGLVYIYHLRGR